jgi:oxygen-dependent protoporphyrinogen oxidase
VSIQVVNLWYPTPGLHHPHGGFGYLIPQSVSQKQNPEGALGVLFDSDRELGDMVASNARPVRDSVPGTKLTVMLGGHLWDDLPASFWPDADAAAEMAMSVVERHLGIPRSDRVVASSKACRQCIPQHYKGHLHKLVAAHDELEAAFQGRLAVAGGSYTLPGVLPSLRAARDIAAQVAGRWRDKKTGNEAQTSVGNSGLGRFRTGLILSSIPYEALPYRYGNPSPQFGALDNKE